MKNQSYLEHWDDYQRQFTSDHPILLPMELSLSPEGLIDRERMRAPRVKELYLECRDRDFPDHLKDHPKRFGNADEVFRDYVDYFAPLDGAQAPGVRSPLDLSMRHPTWILFYLTNPNWKFSVHRQYSVENDRDDLLRNFAKVCTLDDRNALLLSNACLSAPDDLKFNLHVTIYQDIDGRPAETDIIIDPGAKNTGGIGDGTPPPPPPPPPTGGG